MIFFLLDNFVLVFCVTRIFLRYMAVKTHEQKTSQREAQLERKARGLEEELHSLKLQLEREKFTNENKKLKVGVPIYSFL